MLSVSYDSMNILRLYGLYIIWILSSSLTDRATDLISIILLFAVNEVPATLRPSKSEVKEGADF